MKPKSKTKLKKHQFKYGDDNIAGDNDLALLESEVRVEDARELLTRGKAFIKAFDLYGNEDSPQMNKVFFPFLEALYGSGMVMHDFDYYAFARGPYHLVEEARFSSVLRETANLWTVRMYFHTIARDHRSSSSQGGYFGFQEAWRSGCLQALLDRLETLFADAEPDADDSPENR